MITAVAIVAVRNEELHIQRCIKDLTSEGVDVILIDNDSTDDTVLLAKSFIGKGLLSIERLPWMGSFSLPDVLEMKECIARRVEHDWIIHTDADEWLSSPAENETLLEGIMAAEASGANCINFNEFVFTPAAGESFSGDEYSRLMLRYYFFQPTYPRLMRAWKRNSRLCNKGCGGHVLTGADVKRHENDFILRHYIALGLEQVRAKYLQRRFSAEGLQRGWHGNRINMTEANLTLPTPAELLSLPDWRSKCFSTARPQAKHFWEWRQQEL